MDDDRLWVDLEDGRTIGVPLAWFPRLLHATPEQREAFELSHRGIHWDALDEDVSVAALLSGHGDMTLRPKSPSHHHWHGGMSMFHLRHRG